jgi:hypothetical protein
MELRYPHAADQEKIRASLVKLGYEQPEVSSFGTAQDVMLRLPIRKDATGGNTSATVFTALCAAENGAPKQVQHDGQRRERRPHQLRECGRRRSGQPAARRLRRRRRSATNWPRTA